MTVFYDSVDYIDYDISDLADAKKVILDPFCDTAPDGFILADSSIRDCIEIWARPFLYMQDNKYDKYRIITDYPYAYNNRAMDYALIDVNKKAG